MRISWCFILLGLIVGCPLAIKNGGVVVARVRVNFAGTGGVVRGLAASHAVLVAPEIFQYFPGVYRLAVVS
jgi:hypothetical protein